MSEDKGNISVVDIQMEEVGNYKILRHKKKAFLAAFAETGNITAASKLSGVTRQAHYDWMKDDSDYPKLFQAADQEAAENLESEARRRATQGTAKPVFYQGEKCGTVQEYSDTLLIFLMKGAMPDKYSEKYQSQIDHNINITVDTPEERRDRIAELLSKKELIEAIDVTSTTICSVLDEESTNDGNSDD